MIVLTIKWRNQKTRSSHLSRAQLEDSVNDLAFYPEVFSLLVAEQLIDVIARVVMMLMYDPAVSSFTSSTVPPIKTLTPTEISTALGPMVEGSTQASCSLQQTETRMKKSSF